MFVTKLYNFFCGLHLLVNIAEVMNAVFKEWEKTKEIANKPNENYSSNDSSTIMFVRESCKAFVTGGDNKNGAALEFITYLRRNEIYSCPIKPFRGNRFNIIFHNASSIYYLHNHRAVYTFLKISVILMNFVSTLSNLSVISNL